MTNKFIKKVISCTLGYLLLACIIQVYTSDAFAEVILIANKSVTTDTIAKSDIRDIFLGEQIKWDDGQQIVLATIKQSKVHDEFTKTFTRKSPSQFSSYWKAMVFTGKGTAPRKLKTEKDVLDFVASNKGAIGYISSTANLGDVKIIKVSDM